MMTKLPEVGQRSCECHGRVQDQVGPWGFEQPALVEDVPALCRAVALDGL